jgi:3-dehydroquinate synthase
MVEVVKYGIIRDAGFFAWLEEHLDQLKALDGEAVLHAVRRSCEIKAEVVAADERESGLRAVLNYGHTVGHALEALGAYERFRHGEAVAIGMEVAARLARLHAELTEADARRQHDVLERLGVPTSIEGVRAENVVQRLALDKKARAGRPRFVLAHRIGEVAVCSDVPMAAVRDALLACGADP